MKRKRLHERCRPDLEALEARWVPAGVILRADANLAILLDIGQQAKEESPRSAEMGSLPPLTPFYAPQPVPPREGMPILAIVVPVNGQVERPSEVIPLLGEQVDSLTDPDTADWEKLVPELDIVHERNPDLVDEAMHLLLDEDQRFDDG